MHFSSCTWRRILTECLVKFCLLEQCTPNGDKHPFASTMLAHFRKLNSPIRAVVKYPRIEDQIQRFRDLKWNAVSAKSLWTYWNDTDYFKALERSQLNQIEQFDEWEEFALFSTHYFFLVASNQKTTAAQPALSYLTESNLRNETHTSTVPVRSQIGSCPPRRYAALYRSEKTTFEFYGGTNGSRRLSSSDTFSLASASRVSNLSQLPNPAVRIFHTVTMMGSGYDCLLVGGRDGPDKPLSDSWLRQDDIWRRVDDLPYPLYRHAATSVKDRQGRDGVLVFGGRSRKGEPSATWYLWQEHAGWKTVQCGYQRITPCFGAVLFSYRSKETGVLLGGMSDDGSIISNYLHWSLGFENGLLWISLEPQSEKDQHSSICRFGAQAVCSPLASYLVGGIEASGLPKSAFEVVQLDRELAHSSEVLECSPLPHWNGSDFDPQPLLIGHSAIWDGDGLVVIGGGATCFSFGNYSNTAIWRFDQNGHGGMAPWKLLRVEKIPSEARQALEEQEQIMGPIEHHTTGASSGFIPIKRIELRSRETFEKRVMERKPCMFEKVDMGPCVEKWTNEYLKNTIGDKRTFDIHHAQEDTMLFESKNFVIKKNTFSELIDAIASGEKRYLRSVSSHDRYKPADFVSDFEALASDFALTDRLHIPASQVHSKVFRVSGPINMWLHYDVGVRPYSRNWYQRLTGVARFFQTSSARSAGAKD